MKVWISCIAHLEIQLSIRARCSPTILISTKIVTIAWVYLWWVMERQVYSSNQCNPRMAALRDRAGFKQVCRAPVRKSASSPFHTVGDRLLALNHHSIDGMTVPELADAISAAPNPCRLRLLRQGLATIDRKERAPRPASVDGDSFLQQQKYRRNSLNRLVVGLSPSCRLHAFFPRHPSRSRSPMETFLSLSHHCVCCPMKVSFLKPRIIPVRVILKVPFFLLLSIGPVIRASDFSLLYVAVDSFTNSRSDVDCYLGWSWFGSRRSWHIHQESYARWCSGKIQPTERRSYPTEEYFSFQSDFLLYRRQDSRSERLFVSTSDACRSGGTISSSTGTEMSPPHSTPHLYK